MILLSLVDILRLSFSSLPTANGYPPTTATWTLISLTHVFIFLKIPYSIAVSIYKGLYNFWLQRSYMKYSLYVSCYPLHYSLLTLSHCVYPDNFLVYQSDLGDRPFSPGGWPRPGSPLSVMSLQQYGTQSLSITSYLQILSLISRTLFSSVGGTPVASRITNTSFSVPIWYISPNLPLLLSYFRFVIYLLASWEIIRRWSELMYFLSISLRYIFPCLIRPL